MATMPAAGLFDSGFLSPHACPGVILARLGRNSARFGCRRRKTVLPCERLLHTEARLIDGLRLEAWLALFTEDCAYWIPADVTGADPARFVSWEFNDRRRLEERVERLEGGRRLFANPDHPHRPSLFEYRDADRGRRRHGSAVGQFLIQANLLGPREPARGVERVSAAPNGHRVAHRAEADRPVRRRSFPAQQQFYAMTAEGRRA